MAELTHEQVERAAKAHFDCDSMPAWDRASEQTKGAWRKAIRAAAPFLQLPWDTPTIEEATKANQCMDGQSAIFDFLRYRNAAIMVPKPVDPRKARAVELLLSRFEDDVEKFAERLIAELDATSVAASQSDDHVG